MRQDVADRVFGRPESYVHGYGSTTLQWLERRTAATSAGFLLPHVRPGMRLLDCGCGPGSVTLGLAEAVAPGEVTGVDMNQRSLERARALARERGLANVRFEVGDVYGLAFPDASFDVVFAQALLMHLKDRTAAIREVKRVLKPGGLVVLSDNDHTAVFWEPSTPKLRDVHALWMRVVRHLGGDPCYARHQRRLLLDAGFTRVEAHLTTGVGGFHGNLEDTRLFAAMLSEQLREPLFVETVTRQGWADEATLDTMIDELRRWGEQPDAFAAFPACAAIGWKDEAT